MQMETRPEDKRIPPADPAKVIDKAEDQKTNRGFWRHVFVGYTIGIGVGAILFVMLLITMSKLELQIPIILTIAALAQLGTGGGLLGAGIYVSKITDRDDKYPPPSISDQPPSAQNGRHQQRSCRATLHWRKRPV